MKQINAIIVACMLIALPWSRGASSLPILLFALVFLLSGDWSNKWKNIKENIFLILPFSLYFLVHLVGLIYTSNQQEAYAEISKKLNLFFLPFLLFSVYPALQENKKEILIAFIFSLLIFFLTAINIAFQQYVAGDKLAFFYVHFVRFSNMHPSYLSMYALLGIALSYDWAIHYGKKYLLFMLPLFIFILLLVARTEFIILFILLILIWLYHFFVRKKYWISIGGIALIIMVSGIAIINIPELNTRFSVIIEPKKDASTNWSITNEREKIWGVAWKRIMKKPYLGIGTGASAEVLNRDFKKIGFVSLSYKTAINNAHNQFLQQWFALGLAGLITCLLLYLSLFWQAFKQQNFMLFLLAVIISIASITECILESQSGIVFLIVCFVLFAIDKKKVATK